jgi:hypothetical protein
MFYFQNCAPDSVVACPGQSIHKIVPLDDADLRRAIVWDGTATECARAKR